jgi:hypothetical protein
MKMLTFVSARRGYVLVALALVSSLLGAGGHWSGFGSGDW